MRNLLFIGWFIGSLWLPAQGVTTKDCLTQLNAFQTKEEGFYPKGTFPTGRYWLNSEREEDNGVFSTASVAYILRDIQKRKPDDQLDLIISRAISSFENYRSRRGAPAYNYWQTIGDDLPFPNNKLLSRERLRLPDDYDDTAMIQLARGPNPLDQAVRDKMVAYAMRDKRKAVLRFPIEQHRSYEVWFADKMDQELDVVVMSNVLLFVMDRGYAWKTPDQHTARVLQSCIDNAGYFKDPIACSPHYNQAPLILYHLARMVAADKSDMFQPQRARLILDLNTALELTDHNIEKLLIATSLLRLGEKVSMELSYRDLLKDAKSFVYYSYDTPVMPILPKFYWRSEAVSWALIYEFLSFDPTVRWTD